MTHYQESIIKATGCQESEAPIIEDIMRHVIFHSTLDWQTKQQFDKGARDALDVHLYELGLDNPDQVKRFGKIWDKKINTETAERVLDTIINDNIAWDGWKKFSRLHKLRLATVK